MSIDIEAARAHIENEETARLFPGSTAAYLRAALDELEAARAQLDAVRRIVSGKSWLDQSEMDRIRTALAGVPVVPAPEPAMVDCPTCGGHGFLGPYSDEAEGYTGPECDRCDDNYKVPAPVQETDQ